MKRIATVMSVIALGLLNRAPAIAQTNDPCENYAIAQCAGDGYATKGFYTYQNCRNYYYYSCQETGGGGGPDGCGHPWISDPCGNEN